MAYSGTIVVSTGTDTEIGRINAMLSDVEPLTTPLLQQVNCFGLYLGGIIIAVAGSIFTLGSFLARMPVSKLFLSVVGIAVAAIPEGLPTGTSIILSIGVRRTVSRNAIIRRLPGVETLGSVSIICTDKTGTLTKSEMIVTYLIFRDASVDVRGAGCAPRGELSPDGKAWDLAAEGFRILAAAVKNAES
ncbi:hypothetical protein [Marispirochaeta sp.]|uniref:P-type ATPase n=1 Tax=Marispirochaeta sp. TaxID=2038653 RepID=UPI0029C9AA8B|nr:hypothetical protein [Marispirochaeta sp.]